MKAKVITIGALLILVGGTWFALSPNDVVIVDDIKDIKFEKSDIVFTRENIEIATSTDEFGNIIKTGIRIPITYDFLVATTTGFVIEEKNEYIEMSLGGYNQCRETKAKPQCVQELKDDIEQTIEAHQINVKRSLDEIKNQQFGEELILQDF